MRQILEVFPYESSRKRMSILVRLPPALVELCGGGCAERLYCKGADSVLFERLGSGGGGEQTEGLASLLEEWAEVALRTLVWAKRELPEFAAWQARYHDAASDPLEVQKRSSRASDWVTFACGV